MRWPRKNDDLMDFILHSYSFGTSLLNWFYRGLNTVEVEQEVSAPHDEWCLLRIRDITPDTFWQAAEERAWSKGWSKGKWCVCELIGFRGNEIASIKAIAMNPFVCWIAHFQFISWSLQPKSELLVVNHSMNSHSNSMIIVTLDAWPKLNKLY